MYLKKNCSLFLLFKLQFVYNYQTRILIYHAPSFKESNVTNFKFVLLLLIILVAVLFLEVVLRKIACVFMVVLSYDLISADSPLVAGQSEKPSEKWYSKVG